MSQKSFKNQMSVCLQQQLLLKIAVSHWAAFFVSTMPAFEIIFLTVSYLWSTSTFFFQILYAVHIKRWTLRWTGKKCPSVKKRKKSSVWFCVSAACAVSSHFACSRFALIVEQESCAITKMTEQFTLYMGALEIFRTPWLRPRLIFPIFMGFCSDGTARKSVGEFL